MEKIGVIRDIQEGNNGAYFIVLSGSTKKYKDGQYKSVKTDLAFYLRPKMANEVLGDINIKDKVVITFKIESYKNVYNFKNSWYSSLVISKIEKYDKEKHKDRFNRVLKDKPNDSFELDWNESDFDNNTD